MARKTRQPVEEAFTLQFGEPDDGVIDSEEIVSSDDPHLDDQFMWRNAAAVLSESDAQSPLEDERAEIDDVPDNATDAASGYLTAEETGKVQINDGSGFDKQVYDLPASPLAPRLDDEPVVVDERFDEPMVSGPLAETYDEPEPVEDDLDVLDERQAAMVGPLVREETSSRDMAAGSIGAEAELRADPDASVFPRPYGERAEFREDGEAAPLFAKDAVEVPTAISPITTGRKAPWVLYGTLAAGIAVLGIAFVGMMLQLDRSPEEAPVGVAEASGTAAGSGGAKAPDDVEIDAQLRVLRLAVGPFYDGKSRVQPYDGDPAVMYVLPTDISKSKPDAGFVPPEVRQDNVTLVLETETLGDGTGQNQDQAVVTVTEDRIEIDLTEDTDAEQSVLALNSEAQTTTVIDPTVKVADAPELTALEAPTIESPEAERVAQELVAAIETIEVDVQSTASVWSEVVEPKAVAMTGFAPAEDAVVVRQTVLSLPAFDLEKSARVNFSPPFATRAPLVAVRLVAANGNGATEGIALPAVIGADQLPSRALSPEPISAQVAPDPNLPVATIDVSREVAAALAAKIEAEERLAAALARAENLEPVAESAQADRTETVEAPVVQQTETAAELTAPEPEPSVAQEVAQSINAVDEEENLSVMAAVVPDVAEPEAAVVEVPAETQTEVALRDWVQNGAWVPEIGVETVQTTLEGRPVLEVIGIDANSVLPDWVQVGSLIVRANDTPVASGSDLTSALTERSRSLETGSVAALFEIVLRKGLDPRAARIEVPVWRRVVLADETEIVMRPNGSKWEATVVSEGRTQEDGLVAGDILLRDFATKSNLRAPMALEEMFEAMADGDAQRVDFAIMRSGELASGGVSLTD